MLYQHAPRAIPFQIIGASIVVVALRAEISANWLSLWWLILTGLTVYRIWYVHRSKRLVDDQQTTVSLQIHFLGVVATGLTWGAGYLFFTSQSSIEHQAMLIMVLAGITAGGLVASYGVKHHFFRIPVSRPWCTDPLRTVRRRAYPNLDQCADHRFCHRLNHWVSALCSSNS